MTLAIACITDDYIIHISDRRTTSFIPPFKPLDDEVNKSILFDWSVSFSFAGRANMGKYTTDEKVDDWLVRKIAEVSSGDYKRVILEHIRVEATKAFALMDCTNSEKRHVFQAVGWFKHANESIHRPVLSLISNAIDYQTGEWLDEANEEFTVSESVITDFPRGHNLYAIGEKIHQMDKNAITRLMQKCVKHKFTSPKRLANALIICMQWLSRRYPRIGNGLMIICIPKKSVISSDLTGEGMILTGGPPDFDAIYSYYITTGTDKKFQLFPHVILRNGGIIKGTICKFG